MTNKKSNSRKTKRCYFDAQTKSFFFFGYDFEILFAILQYCELKKIYPSLITEQLSRHNIKMINVSFFNYDKTVYNELKFIIKENFNQSV